ncbi:class IV adenylate cyclase [candidate division KSB1 bacterium]|nr:class IV adenylate cyclase [candidate division KSB1 bacterium]
MTNFEFKARLEDTRTVQAEMARRHAEIISIMLHTDTYFHVSKGRLKLREIAFLPVPNAKSALPPPHSELIFYLRSDDASVRRSDYLITPVAHADSMRVLLDSACGTRVAVKKRRVLYLLGYERSPYDPKAPHIRVHLDTVEQLGSFVEVEAVMGEGITPELAQREAQSLLHEFGVREQLLNESYVDLLERTRS